MMNTTRIARGFKMARTVRWLVPTTAVLIVALADPAFAAVTVTRAEVSGSGLRIEGSAIAARSITVDGIVMGTSDSSGSFRIQRDPYTRPADCTVDVKDGSTAVTVTRLSGCTVIGPVPPPPGDTTPPTVPVNLTASLAGTTANLSWTASTDNTGVTGYTITRNGAFHTTVLNTFYNGTNLAPGTYTYTVAATDGAGNVSGPSNSASVTVAPPPLTDTTAPSVPANLVTTLVGTTISLSWEISTDDTAVTGYRVTRNNTVRGTTNGTTFLESGLAAGTYTYTVAAFDGVGNTSGQSNSISVTVGAPAPFGFITPSRLPDATVGQAYLGYIVASDPPGPSSFRFKLVSGKVPAGTSFVGNSLPTRPEARVVGTPTAVGTSTFTVDVSDGAGATARRTFSISVLAAPGLAIEGGVNVLNAGTVGAPYGAVLSATGGVRPYTWAITSGTLPPGLSLVGDAFFGTPTTAGTYGFTARVTDSRGATASGQFAIAVGQ